MHHQNCTYLKYQFICCALAYKRICILYVGCSSLLHITQFPRNHATKGLECGVSDCRHLGLSTFWSVDILSCRYFGLSTFRFVDGWVCRRFGCQRFGLSKYSLVIFNPLLEKKFADGNIVGRLMHAETVYHTSIFFYPSDAHRTVSRDYKDKAVVKSSFLYKRNLCVSELAYLYWDGYTIVVEIQTDYTSSKSKWFTSKTTKIKQVSSQTMYFHSLGWN